MVEITRAFSYKLNIPGAYESRDFFCSQKIECNEDEAETKSEALYEFCKRQVMKSVASYQKEQQVLKADPLKRIKDLVVAGHQFTVEEWEACTPEEQNYLQTVKKSNNRIAYRAQKMSELERYEKNSEES